jgi:hypothetical protein
MVRLRLGFLIASSFQVFFYLDSAGKCLVKEFTGTHISSNSNLRKESNGRPDTRVFMPGPESHSEGGMDLDWIN